LTLPGSIQVNQCSTACGSYDDFIDKIAAADKEATEPMVLSEG
jgi:hypothetical protein